MPCSSERESFNVVVPDDALGAAPHDVEIKAVLDRFYDALLGIVVVTFQAELVLSVWDAQIRTEKLKRTIN